jgi:hypothetical protein
VPIRTRHSTISPAARLTAEQPQQGMLDTNIVIVLRWIDPAQLSAGPHPGAGQRPQDTYDEHAERARRREILQRAESEFDSAPFDAEAAPASLAASQPRSSPHADSHDDRSANTMIAATATAEWLPYSPPNTDDLAGLDTLTRRPP